MADGSIGLWTVPLAVFGGAIRVSTPFLFVSLGECITERSGRINLGLEGTLIMGAMSAYGISYLSGSPWLGVLAAGITGALFGALHAGICSLPRVNDIAVGIALMLFGTGLAFYLGKPLIEPTAARLPAIDFGWWSDIPQVRAALRINVLFLIGVAIAGLWRCRSPWTRAAVGRRHLRLPSVQRRALHPDARDHDHHLLAEAHADRRAGRTVHHPISGASHARALHQIRTLCVAL